MVSYFENAQKSRLAAIIWSLALPSVVSQNATQPPLSASAIECRFTAIARDGDTCTTMADRYRISVTELVAWNSDNLNGVNCTLVTGNEYCVLSGISPRSFQSAYNDKIY